MSETSQTTALDTFQHFLRYAAQPDTCIEVHEMPPLGGTAHFGHEGTKQIVSEIERLQKELGEVRGDLEVAKLQLKARETTYVSTIRQQTIEECAKVAEGQVFRSDRPFDPYQIEEIAKAIRSLDGGGK